MFYNILFCFVFFCVIIILFIIKKYKLLIEMNIEINVIRVNLYFLKIINKNINEKKNNC